MLSGSTGTTCERDEPSFHLLGGDGELTATGVGRRLPAGPIASLAQRVSHFFREATQDDAPLVGAIPFDRAAEDALYQPLVVRRRSNGIPASPPAPAVSIGRVRMAREPDVAHFAATVRRSLDRMRPACAEGDALTKIVLSRSLAIFAERAIDPSALLAQLQRDRNVTAFCAPLPSLAGTPRWLVGATPELLVRRDGLAVLSHPLAGSAKRHRDPAVDRQAGVTLQRSQKDLREHRAVTEEILDALAPHCADLGTLDGTTLHATATMWHLGTRIVGTLRSRDTTVADLVALLHPTPAVCGLPRERAADIIRREEGYDRGFYAGAVGWMDGQGDGEWYVSLRCAEIAGHHIRVYAGAGVVEGSDPAAETAETSAKFVAMLTALGLDENGRSLGEVAA